MNRKMIWKSPRLISFGADSSSPNLISVYKKPDLGDWCQLVMSGPKFVRLGPTGTYLTLFKISFLFNFDQREEMDENWYEKVKK